MDTLNHSFIPGSEWVYFKIYMGPSTADLILTEELLPFSKKRLEEGLIDKWFFIRYEDPDHHLRIRFHLTSSLSINNILIGVNELLNPYLDMGQIWKVQLDTYNREIERYGEETIVLSETIFFYDSMMVSHVLTEIKENFSETERWLCGIKIMDVILDAAGLTLEEKINLIEEIKISFEKEFGMDKSLKIQLDKKYRIYKGLIENILYDEGNEGQDNLEKLKALIVDNISPVEPIFREIKDKLNDKYREALGSYLHLSINRLILSKPRIHELVMHFLLFKYYKSLVGKKKNELQGQS